MQKQLERLCEAKVFLFFFLFFRLLQIPLPLAAVGIERTFRTPYACTYLLDLGSHCFVSTLAPIVAFLLKVRVFGGPK